MKSDKISIIIPCYNDAEFIEQSVQSALDQTYENKEIIVVDDGSDAETKSILKSLEPIITYLITQENKGTSAARNTGIAAATGEYILVLDSDDFFDPEFCEKAINKLGEDSGIKMVTCYARWFRFEKDFQIIKPSGGKLEDFLKKNCSLGTIFRKMDWERTGGYDESMIKGYEDWELYIRLHKGGGATYVIPEILFHYRKKVNSRNVIANSHKYELLEYIYLKHNSLYKDNFEIFIKYFLDLLESREREKIKKAQQIDFKLGKFILGPFRKIKIILRSF